jgi:hypothetical protein
MLDAKIKMTASAQDHIHKEREHKLGVAETVLGMAATAHAHDTKMES